MRYLAKLHRGPGGVYGVAVVDPPGCFTVSDTLDETITNAAETILCHLEGMLAAGESIPQPIVGGSWLLPGTQIGNMLWAALDRSERFTREAKGCYRLLDDPDEIPGPAPFPIRAVGVS